MFADGERVNMIQATTKKLRFLYLFLFDARETTKFSYMTIKVKQKYSWAQQRMYKIQRVQIYTAEIQTPHGLKAQIKIM
jgi:hypothetical protein